ncbi:hypothetical protein HYT02_06105, partial [Candidatus Gottesmanbacteria bacterium]|nr:hypothetical protein [Candidatus Gottesmanbacteria bacterium]
MKSSSTKVEYNPGDIEPKWPSSVPLSGTSAGKEDYNPSAIEQKWQGIWEQRKVFSPKLKEAKKPFYNLNMF